MNGTYSNLAKRIEAKYGKTGLGEIYEIDGKSYKLTDGSTDHVTKRVEKFIEKMDSYKLDS